MRSIEAQFRDRTEAGQLLAEKLISYAKAENVLVLALPRGGVPVGFQVARALHVPLDILVVRKLGLPGREELAMGAIASGGVRILNKPVIRWARVSNAAIDAITAREQVELERRELAYRGYASAPQVSGKIIVLIDDGIATGSTMRAAVATLRLRHPARIVVAVPVAPASSIDALRAEADEVLALRTPDAFVGVGQWYENFDQVSDEDVREFFDRFQRQLGECEFIGVSQSQITSPDSKTDEAHQTSSSFGR